MRLGRQFPEYSTLDGTVATPHQPPFSTATFRPLLTAREVDVELSEKSSEGQRKFCSFEQTQRTRQLMVTLNNSPP